MYYRQNELVHEASTSYHLKVPADLSQFWVITILSNPVRYKRRYELYWAFAEMCEAAGIKLITVEQAFGNRKFMVTHPNNKYHLQVRGEDELWLKENMINLGVRHACAIAPGQVREVAWIDADCRPSRPYRDWFDETWHQLQHHEFVQMWEWLIDLDHDSNPIGSPSPSFVANYIKSSCPSAEDCIKIQTDRKFRSSAYYFGNLKGQRFGAPGLAWAANVDALNKVGGIIDFSILGAGDWHMANGLVGSMIVPAEQFKSLRYANKLMDWQQKATRWIKRDVGYVSGIVYHDFHGKKVNRGYTTRGQILIDNKYNPETDIKYDTQGVLQLETWTPRQMKLRDQIRAYFRSRSEDSRP